ncbi:putative transcriptional regulator [Dysgonomonas sp. PFB1-18]|uniref:type VI secretion system baseplate subunit TssF n=1 Tax=unclassified Dysgonomonas TaxID=2630389 RepID=UPI0013D3D82F|nr:MULTISPECIES: type VI secretion system baseplate subunit TssF [unclassified Dysgonomonas]MDH6310023.1 putative transcriptional regulator [Dysgonomonas sp. PF1-14]MDH6339932.1 putative transcriptional regulator [Dysgonomonas sp. PF1-16]MDH6381580.1 putative transcriptional regulator [Dysgonomonas sp. PFB1-18]MDH6398783.1 putative transcriptional regulator [Dysgonomonas sp. PF1-23]
MKSKEAIRTDIIRYANLVWNTKNFNNLNPLVQLMIEEVSHELFLLDNKLEEIDYSVLCKLVKRLSPRMYNYIRPSHAILKVESNKSICKLERKAGFLLKKLPDNIREKDITSVIYTPVTDIILHKVNINYIICDKIIHQLDSSGNRRIVGTTTQRSKYNKVWIGLDIDTEIETLKDIAFYLDFKHLPDHHEYYDILTELKWNFGNKPLKTTYGFPIHNDTNLSKEEKEILDFYRDHFITISSKINIKDIEKENLPKDLIDIVDKEITSSIPPLYWLSVTFPANFSQADIEKMSISLNAFPVINRYYNETDVLEKDFGALVSLSSGILQEFITIETITDLHENEYNCVDYVSIEGEYEVLPTKRKNMDDPRIVDYLERLVDIIHDERSAFTGIDNDKIINVLNAVSSIQDNDTKKIELNRINESAEVALLSVKPCENAGSIYVSYWTTHADLLNGIPEGTTLMANKIPELTKAEVMLLTETNGGRNLYNMESLKAINNFYLTSKNRILTKYNILSFCKIELGGYIENIDVVRKAIISHKLKEGIIIVMEIQVTPKRQYIDYFKQKGVFKDLLIRLQQRSPNNFNYRIKLIE